MTYDRGERDSLERQHKEQRDRAEAADRAVAHNRKRPLAIASGAECVGRVGETVEMEGAGQHREREHDKGKIAAAGPT